MNLYELIEEFNLERYKLTPDMRYEIADSLTDNEILRLVNVFLKGISNKHQVPGRVIEVLMGIAQWHFKNELITRDQKIYAVSNIIDHWHQMSCESRALLNL